MKSYYTYIILSISMLCLAQYSLGQTVKLTDKDYSSFPYWIEMMQDPEANFFETQIAFETYWKDREILKGNGWKPFKRWEAFMQSRVDENGNKPDPAMVSREFISYKNLHARSLPAGCEWNELGPKSVPLNGTSQPTGNGRINEIAFHPSDPNKMFVGAPQGGFWTTTDHGVTWTTSTDGMSTLGVSAIVVDHTNPQVIYIGTGDRDHGDAPGLGIYKSTDGGVNFTGSSSGMGNRTVGKILMHPTNNTILLAATSGGIYRSTNSGASWTYVSPVAGHFKDIVFKPGDPQTVYSTYNGGFYRSADNGVSWTLIVSGIPDASRMAIAVCPASTDVVYVLATNSSTFKAVYKSTDAGLNFSTQSTTPNLMDYSSTGSGGSGQAWYCMDIAVDPTNSSIVYVGGVNIFKSTNNGVSWTINAHWVGTGAPSIHADQHTLEFSPINNRLYACHDGGLHYTANGGSNWIDITGSLAIAQVYKIGQSATVKDFVVNGYQDNGTAIYDAGTWRTEIGGDGMECAVDHTDAAYSYGALYYGDVRRSVNSGLSYSRIAANGSNGINESGAWVTPYCISEQDPNTMFIGYDNVWRSTNIKTPVSSSVAWTKITANLGGSTANLDKIEASPANNNLLFVSRSNTLYRSTDALAGSPVWSDLTSGLPGTFFINDIECDPVDPNIVYLLQGYDVYKSINMGASWTMISGTLPNIWMNTIVIEPGSNEALYVGADAGVYYKDASMSDWLLYADQLPVNSEITEIELYLDGGNSANSRIRACTFGRGLWEAPLAGRTETQFTESAVTGCVPLNITFTDESSRCADSWSWQVSGPVNFNGSAQEETFSFTVPGTYTVQLISSNIFGADTLVKLYTIGGPPIVSESVNNQTCDYSFNGSIDLTIQQDNPPYTYNWSGGETTEDISSLGSGNYVVTITDNSGCTDTKQYFVNDDAQILMTTSKKNVTCFNSANGTATINASGNNVPFTYLWNTSPAQTTETITALAGGTYDVTVFDSAGCIKSTAVNVFEPNELTVFMFPNFPSTGQIQVLVSNGIAPYTFNWSNGATTQIISGVAPGFYFCQVKDFNSCAKIPSTTLTVPQQSFGAAPQNHTRSRIEESDDFTIYPNPGNGEFYISYDASVTSTHFVQIHNMIGELVYKGVLLELHGSINQKIDLSHLKAGEYLVSIGTGGKRITKNIVIQ